MKPIDCTSDYFNSHPWLLILLLLIFCSTKLRAESVTPDIRSKQAIFEITKSALYAKIELINANPNLDEAIKSKALTLYQAVLINIGNAENFRQRTSDFKQALRPALGTSNNLPKEISPSLFKTPQQKSGDLNRIPTEELGQQLIDEKEKISVLDEQTQNLENELVLQQARPQHIREEMLTAKQDLESLQTKMAVPFADIKASALEVEANQTNLKSQVDSRMAELDMLEVEIDSIPARTNLLSTALHDLGSQKSTFLPMVSTLENLISERHQLGTKAMLDANNQVKKELSGKYPLIQTLTRENIHYSQDLQAVTNKIDEYTEQKTKVEIKASEIDNDLKSAVKKISLSGLSPALGNILREQRRSLATQDQFSLQAETIQNETASTSLEQFKVDDKLKQLAYIDSTLQDLMKNQVDQNLPLEQRMAIQAELGLLLNAQKELLIKLASEYATYLRVLGDSDFTRQQLVSQTAKFANYLDENLLWVKSADPVDVSIIKGVFQSLQWLISPANGMTLINDEFKVGLQNPILLFIGLVGFVLLLLAKKWAKQQLIVLSIKNQKLYSDSFIDTLQALAYTFIIVLPIPLFSYYLGWVLSNDIHVVAFTRAIGKGLQSASLPLLFLQFFYRIFADEGIARKHFKWQKNTLCLLHKQIAWLRFVAPLTAFIIASTAASKVPLYSDTLGRLAFIVSMAAIAFFLGRLLNPNNGLLQRNINNVPEGWIARLRNVWYLAVICIPLVIIGFAGVGYYLSALELEDKLIISLRLIFLMTILHALVIRWLTLVNRQLALSNAKEKRKNKEISDKNPTGSEDPLLLIDEKIIDIPKINAQTIRLLNVFIGFALVIGFLMIWKNILPAFSFLERIVLWQHLVSSDNQESYQPVTLTNLMLAGVYLFITVVSAQNFSGVMELFVFSRFTIEPGGRYAINQLAKYILLAIGFISIANELGGSWSQVQWLVAALSVGLGFGLQEIFANMVSGIILLFERPIRVGDTVTIDGITGKVIRIQMRATTLIDMDQKDLIVPNKTFITSRLVNWTLSDPITRVEVPIAIAYGSNVTLSRKVMTDTVRSMPIVLATPEPTILFIGFGENSMNFSIGIFVCEISKRLPAINELHIRLEQAFRENEIEIPFPQMDIHIRSVVQPSGAASLSPEILQPKVHDEKEV